MKATRPAASANLSLFPFQAPHEASKYFDHCRWLIWHYKNKANLSSDWGRSHESIIHCKEIKKIQNLRRKRRGI